MQHHFDVLLSKKLLNKFFCDALSRVLPKSKSDGLTCFSLLDLFGHQREGREELYKYLYNHLSHGNSRGDLGIDVEAIQKVFY